MRLAVLLLCLTTTLFAKEPLLVDAAWLAAHAKDADLVLLHVGDENDYAKRHIAGARHVSLGDISVSDHSGKGLMLELPAADDLRTRLEALGISDRSRIVVYYGKDWVSPSTRVLFTLDAAGLGDRASLLDGGMEAWIRAGHPVTDAPAPATRGKLSPLQMRARIIDAAGVKSRLGRGGVSVVDARNASFYDGVDTGGAHGRPHKTGHIAGARSIPYTSVTNDDLTLKSPAALRALFDKAGVKKGDTVIAYCHIGQQATATLFAGRLLGHDVLLYDGSFEDWSRQPYGRVEVGR